MLELTLKILVGFSIIVIMFRLVGRKTLKQATPLDMLFVIIVGDFFTGTAIDKEIKMTDMLLILFLSFGLIYGLEILARNKKISELIEGKTKEIIVNGRIKCDVLESEKMSVEDVENELRTQGIFDLKEVKIGILELSGRISVKKKG